MNLRKIVGDAGGYRGTLSRLIGIEQRMQIHTYIPYYIILYYLETV